MKKPTLEFQLQPWNSEAREPTIVTQFANNIFLSIFFQVSWIRKSDSYILSVDSAVFISDNRFKILRPQPGTEWNLHIK